MKKIHVLVGLALAGAFSAAQALPVDFSGYFRAGNGLNTRGGTATCMSLAGVGGVEDGRHFRLGDECDYVIEPNFDATLVKNKDGSEWHVHFMTSSGGSWNGGGTAWNGNKDLALVFGQVYAYGQNIPQLANGTLWGGRRFYNRLQTGINDRFLENDDGDGVGLDDMNLGAAKLSVAFMNGNNVGASNVSATPKFIAKVSDIKTFAGGSLAIHVKKQFQSKTDDHSTTPATETAKANNVMTSLGLYHNSPLANGNLLLGLRFRAYDDPSVLKNSNLLVAQWGGPLGSSKVNLEGYAEYETGKFRNGDLGTSTRYMVGARFDGPITEIMRWNVEAGVTGLKAQKDAKKQNLTQLTGALVFVPNMEAAVPRIRLYYSYKKWNDAAKVAADARVWGDKTSGSTIGAQAEAWW